MAQQAGAAVTVQIGGTTILATATMSKEARDGIDFFPLMVDYEERYFAAGRIKGPRFIKREGRPSNEAILTGRMIDRGLRPLFPSDMRNEVQVICLPLSLDYENKPDIVAMLAACIAVHISNIPFDGPIAGLRIGMVNGHFIVNPTVDELEYSDLQLVVMGDSKRICMVDCDAKEVSDDVAKSAFNLAMETMGSMAEFIDKIRAEIGVEKAKDEDLVWRGGPDPEDQKVIDELKAEAKKHLDKYLFNTPKGSKGERKEIIHELEKKLIDDFSTKLKIPDRSKEETQEHLENLIDSFFFDFIEEQVTLAILDSDKRVDGRKLNEIRPLVAEIGILPRTHGSGLFSRGETQVLSVATLGAPGDDLSIETMESDGSKKYFHHYNFLPYSVGEVKPIRGAGRREIGHGALAEKAIRQIYPEEENFPYTVRVVTEVMGSNGSSSMAATCGSSLALMDAGVPIKRAVAGIAMGMASDGKRFKILTDIQDMEDGPGGMDFKFTSTKDGITAIQMDTKTRGLSKEIIDATFVDMRKAINEILSVMNKTISKPKPELSPYAPRIIYFMIDPEKIGNVIGPGGKVIRAITEEFDVQIDIEDDGTVLITSTDAERAKMAEKQIKELVRVVEVGEVFQDAKVVKIMNFGAFVNLTPGQDGFLHVSNIEWARVEKVTDRINLGDTVSVKVIKIENGKVDVSAKALLPKPEGYVDRPPRRGPRKGGGWKKKDDRRGKKYGRR
jgi:polyribonucleotide nucleotidyltransferase